MTRSRDISKLADGLGKASLELDANPDKTIL